MPRRARRDEDRPVAPRLRDVLTSSRSALMVDTDGGLSKQLRSIRSFVRRDGRLTSAQSRAMAQLLPLYSVDPERLAELIQESGHNRALQLEIGIGNGDNLVSAAEQNKNDLLIGCEVHRPGIGHTLLQIEKRGLPNVKVVCADAVDVVAMLPPQSLDAIAVYFPDPWPKKRHHKRRLMQQSFADLLRQKVKSNGVLRFATDDPDYAEQVASLLTPESGWLNLAGQGHFSPRPRSRIVTRFEHRALRAGRAIYDITAMPVLSAD